MESLLASVPKLPQPLQATWTDNDIIIAVGRASLVIPRPNGNVVSDDGPDEIPNDRDDELL
jgi:hypothetical protein